LTENQQRTIEQLDTMVASGRIVEDEAVRLCACEGEEEFDAVLAGIWARHVQVHTDAAVAGGAMDPEEAARYLERVRGGEHSRELRARIKGRNASD
jgi:polyhydroxyalkanoate synthesis regulator phasin